MDRPTFEGLRDLPGKVIEGDIRLSRRKALAPVLVAEGIRIANTEDVDLIATITHNTRSGSKTINVHVPGLGAICRLDVDGPPHRPAGRAHKHSLQAPDCPSRNLPDGVIDRPDLLGSSIQDVFTEFCTLAHITHNGALILPS